ncbi:DUF2851 family protein [Antarcticibacterium flavum]|uniref:DUF2851 family protein n=1 Tax=Antarcticibacterium flavum TaxID=2058175 RepID=A0A5B7X5D5_9FLAO|nr:MULTISPECIES: DUF2851 family protein [Antarcticibacterium]MCM4159722.1 DUF2851 domain-containing protein [Antarcticibacterium sp. W02-3]QCY70656.1 DUF2851 family protein [Antarcticibacterium flavum]
MKEDFLHYIWKFKKFNPGLARTVHGDPVTLIDPGMANVNSGPDFFNAKLKIGEQLWAGNVEIHIKSSHWYEHHHEKDEAYDNVILHVVWEDDLEIYRKDNSLLPVMELRDIISPATFQNYRELLLAPNASWINCEGSFHSFEEFDLQNWLERLYLERLEAKSKVLLELLKKYENDWEAVLFRLIAKTFGLKVNGSAFLSMAQSFDFKVVRKCRDSLLSLEALFLGQSGLLEEEVEDVYFKELKKEHLYLKKKYRLENKYVERPKFFRLRPDNFPGLRLAQLAALYNGVPHLFSAVVEAGSVQDLKRIFSVAPSAFWKTHYTFSKEHTARNKKLSAAFVDLLIINSLLPVRFSYEKITGTGDPSVILNMVEQLKVENNTVINKFNSIRPGIGTTALDSQALLELKNNYCDKNACLQCNLGIKLLKGEA